MQADCNATTIEIGKVVKQSIVVLASSYRYDTIPRGSISIFKY